MVETPSIRIMAYLWVSAVRGEISRRPHPGPLEQQKARHASCGTGFRTWRLFADGARLKTSNFWGLQPGELRADSGFFTGEDQLATALHSSGGGECAHRG